MLFVSDNYGYRIQVFRQDDTPYGYVFERSFNMPREFIAADICAMSGNVYALGYSELVDGVIHKMTAMGEHVTSFGEPYKSDNSLVRSLLSEEGRLECSEKHQVIGYVNSHILTLTGYDETGTLLWRVKFADQKLSPVEEGIHENGQPSVTYRLPESGESTSLALLSDSFNDKVFPREGLRRRPRRPATTVADVRKLDLSARTFPTDFSGLFRLVFDRPPHAAGCQAGRRRPARHPPDPGRLGRPLPVGAQAVGERSAFPGPGRSAG